MAYNRNIPQPTDLLSNSQPSILSNFQAIDSGTSLTGIGFSRNHVTMTDATNGGLHSRVDFYQALSDPVISGFVSSCYPKNDTRGSLSSSVQLYYNNGAGAYPITGAVSAATNGFCYLPGGILLKWGSFTASSGNNTFNFPTGATIPVFVSCFQVILQPSGAGGSPDYFAYINSGSPTPTGFSYDSVKRTSNSGTTGVYSYLAIGN